MRKADTPPTVTPPELARRYRVATKKVLGWIRTGELAAMNLANRGCTRPRYIIPDEAIAEFEARAPSGSGRRYIDDPKASPRSDDGGKAIRVKGSGRPLSAAGSAFFVPRRRRSLMFAANPTTISTPTANGASLTLDATPSPRSSQ